MSKEEKKKEEKNRRDIYILKIVKTYVLKLWNAVWSCSALDGNFFCQQDNLISKSFLNCTRISIFQMSISIAFMRTFPEKKLKFVTYDHTCILKMHNVYDDYLRYVGGKKLWFGSRHCLELTMLTYKYIIYYCKQSHGWVN